MDAGPPATGARPSPQPPPPSLAAASDGSRLSSDGRPHAAAVVADRNGGPVKALVLNASMDPLCVVPARRALVLVLSEKADVLHANGHRYRSERLDLAAPSVVRLRRYVHVPYRRRAALSRHGVFIRDAHACQYCGRSAENVDHVVPRSRGGPHDWENVVASCRRCNSRKKDRTPEEAGMTLRRAPFAPRPAFWLVVAVGRVQPDWDAYLGDVLSPD